MQEYRRKKPSIELAIERERKFVVCSQIKYGEITRECC
jgi:hypothetical protein